MTGSTLAALAASLLSLLFSYIPGFKTWYTPKDPYPKRLIMLALVVVVALGAFSFACAGLADDFSVKGHLRRLRRLGSCPRRDRRSGSQPGYLPDLSP